MIRREAVWEDGALRELRQLRQLARSGRPFTHQPSKWEVQVMSAGAALLQGGVTLKPESHVAKAVLKLAA